MVWVGIVLGVMTRWNVEDTGVLCMFVFVYLSFADVREEETMMERAKRQFLPFVGGYLIMTVVLYETYAIYEVTQRVMMLSIVPPCNCTCPPIPKPGPTE